MTPILLPGDWISYRSSVANVCRRQDVGETVPECDGCGCELDRRPVAHSPRCPKATV